jgi:hypothetical protein
MKHFSIEYYEKLVNEHRFISAVINHMQNPGIASQKVRLHGQDYYAQALSNLKVKRVELESQIDVLGDFLNG